MQSFIMALRSIGANKMRAVLTMLGIIIGVMALVVLVSLVNGATSSVTSEIASLGNSLVTVSISDDKGQPITQKDLNNWMETEPNLGLLAPYKTGSVVGKFGATYNSVTVYGTTPAYYEIVLKGKAARDSESFAMLDIVHDSISFDLGFFYSGALGNPAQMFRKLLADETSANFASYWGANGAALEASVKALIEAYK